MKCVKANKHVNFSGGKLFEDLLSPCSAQRPRILDYVERKLPLCDVDLTQQEQSMRCVHRGSETQNMLERIAFDQMEQCEWLMLSQTHEHMFLFEECQLHVWQNRRVQTLSVSGMRYRSSAALKKSGL
jgi:hypothetical protein